MCGDRRFAAASASRRKRVDRELRRVIVAGAEHLGPDQLDRRRPREHAVRRLVDLAHAAAAEQLAQLVAAHLARPARPAGRARDDVRDDDGDADEQVVRVVHEQHVASAGPKSQRPRALAISMPIGFIETASNPATSIFIGVLGTKAANISTTAPSHEMTGKTGVPLGTGSQCRS